MKSYHKELWKEIPTRMDFVNITPEVEEAADIIVTTMNKTISQKRVTYDFERLMEGATLLKCSEFGDALIQNM